MVSAGARRRSKSIVIVGDLPEPIGGTSVRCWHVCDALARRGVPVHFLDTEPGPRKMLPPLASHSIVTGSPLKAASAPASLPGVLLEFARLSPSVRAALGPREIGASLLMAARIVKQVKRSGARVIATHHLWRRSLAALLASRVTKSRLVVFLVGGSEYDKVGWARMQPMSTVIACAADRVIANSRATADLWRVEVGRNDIEVIHPGVDHEIFFPAPAPVERDFLRVLFVGQVSLRKGPVVLARAVPAVRASMPVRFAFVGPDHGATKVIRKVATELGITDCIDLVGPVDHDLLPNVYRDADVLAFPSLAENEGFGLVAAEAMACGLAVVASDVGGVSEVVRDGYTGLLVRPGDSDDLASKLSTVLGDDELRQRFSAAGAEHASGFDWSAIADALIDEIEY